MHTKMAINVSPPPGIPEHLAIGPLRITPPVVLAPMAGITDVAFRQLVREFGGGLFIGEMISAELLAAGDPVTRSMVRFFPGEAIRSVQLYATQPQALRYAITILRSEFGVHHIDLNFGCPVPKITRKGGGAALPLHRELFPRLLEAAVSAAAGIPITIKIRMGLDAAFQYYLDIAQMAHTFGIHALTLHARTADQFYAGEARWDAIRRVVQAVPELPIIGNGDVWTAEHALSMLQQTGCAGVGIGRAVLGRPFLFARFNALFSGRVLPPYPVLREVAAIARRHLELMVQYYPEAVAVRRLRKHWKWYFQGFQDARQWMSQLLQAERAKEVEDLLRKMNSLEPYPLTEIWMPRGKRGKQPKVVLPESLRRRLATGRFDITPVTGSGG